MNIETWILSKQPNWKDWQKLDAVFLSDAILLSMDICPYWYKSVVLGAVTNFIDMSEYRDKDADSKYEDIKDIHKAIQQEFNDRLRIAQSWVSKQDWVIGGEIITPEDIHPDMYVSLKKFIEFAFGTMAYKNSADNIPELIKGSVGNSMETRLLSSSEWKTKAKLYAGEYLQNNSGLKQDAVVALIYERFKLEKILLSHSGGKEISSGSIKDALSTDAWFSTTRRNFKPSK